MASVIPPITHPLGRNWKQPPVDAIEVDETHAMMELATLDALPDYSHSIPTAAYEGKMWKRRMERGQGWLLCWYGKALDPDKVSINIREILVPDTPAHQQEG